MNHAPAPTPAATVNIEVVTTPGGIPLLDFEDGVTATQMWAQLSRADELVGMLQRILPEDSVLPLFVSLPGDGLDKVVVEITGTWHDEDDYRDDKELVVDVPIYLDALDDTEPDEAAAAA